MKGTIQKMPIQMTNLNNKNTRIIIGNPGCGKTTRLIAELQKVYKAGTPLSRIAFSSFSVASIEEATERAIVSLQNDTQKDKIFLPYFKTLHAVAFQMLGLDANSLLTTQQLKEFASLQGIKVTGVDKRIGLPHRMTSGDKIMQIINVANLYDVPIRQYMIAQDIHEFPVKFVEDIAMRYRDFKIATSLYDYTDMLIMAKNRDLALPELDYLFIDEAQDLSTLQWILVNRMASKAGHIIIAGDDKQSINEFAGADVDTFLSLPGKVEVLKQSYRIPKNVYQKANKLMQQMVKFRKEGSNWLPRKEEEGIVKTITSIPLAEIAQGNWLILARGGYQLNSLKEQLFACEAGKKPILFTLNGAPPIDMEAYRAVHLFKMYETLDGFQDLVTLKDTDTAEIRKQKLDYIVLFKKFMNVPLDNMQPWEISEKIKHKLTLNWFEALDKLTLIERRYIKHTYKYYVKKGNDMFKDTPVKLMTIHAAKGREADNVLVYLNVPRTVEESLCLKDTDIEIKTLYVAITRAKKKLLLYLPKRQRFSYANLL